MPLPTPLPYGIRDIKVTPYTDAAATTLAATSIDLPNARTLSFSETEEFTELRGDDEVVTTRGQGPSVEWELEAGGLDFAACKAMQGGTILSFPVVEAEDMPVIAADSLSIGFGNFKEAYQIVDRIGIRVLRDNLTNKPFVGFYTTKRVGGDVLHFEAVKFLKFGD